MQMYIYELYVYLFVETVIKEYKGNLLTISGAHLGDMYSSRWFGLIMIYNADECFIVIMLNITLLSKNLNLVYQPHTSYISPSKKRKQKYI